MHTNEHNNLLLVVSFASSRLVSSTSCRTSLFSLASTTRCRLDDICVFDVFDISIARSMHRWVDLLLEERQIDVCSAFKKRTHDAIVASRTTKRYVFVSSLVVSLTFRQCFVIHRRYWRRVDAFLNFAEKVTFSNAKNVESTNVRTKMRALLRIINARNAKNNISRTSKNFLFDIHVNFNRFCDIQQSILNVKRIETSLEIFDSLKERRREIEVEFEDDILFEVKFFEIESLEICLITFRRVNAQKNSLRIISSQYHATLSKKMRSLNETIETLK